MNVFVRTAYPPSVVPERRDWAVYILVQSGEPNPPNARQIYTWRNVVCLVRYGWGHLSAQVHRLHVTFQPTPLRLGNAPLFRLHLGL